jgi:hypothetical protein
MNILPESEVKIKQFYIADKLSIRRISQLLKIDERRISKILKRLKIPIRTTQYTSRKYNLNENYFEKIDTPEKSQVLGMIYADGCLSKRTERSKALSIILREPDNDYLEFIKNQMEYTGPVNRINPKGKNAFYYILAVTSIKIFDDLSLIGLTERKSLTIGFPDESKVSQNLWKYFIRGYLEGDGSIFNIRKDKKNKNGKSRFLSGYVSFCGTMEFLLKLQSILELKLQIKSSISRKKKLEQRNINSHSLRISGNLQVMKFLDWIYEDFKFVMPRKHQKYLDLKSDIEYRESIKDQLLEEKRELCRILSTGRKHTEETKKKCRDKNIAHASLHKNKERWAISPDGIIYHIKGINPFCKEFNLTGPYFGKITHLDYPPGHKCQGWIRYDFDPNNPPAEYIKKFY